MAPDAKQVISDLTKLYKGLTLSRKLMIASVIAVVFSGLAYLILFGQKMDFDYLYTNIDEADAGQIVQELKTLKVDYIATEGAIRVPRDKVYELRMELASKGLPRGKGIGFEIFDNQKLGTSQFVQNLNNRRALEGELARTVAQLDKIEAARVHLVLPKKTLFKEDEVIPTGSVIVKLLPGNRLEKEEVKSIIHLVSGAVEGLKPKHINVVDSNGSMLSRAMTSEDESVWGSSPMDYRAKVEEDMARSVEEIVSHVVGVGKVVAKVTVELDFKKEEKTEEIFDPDQVVVRSEKRIKENRANIEAGPAGAPGAQSNQPAQGPKVGTQNSNSERERGVLNYEINKVVRHTTRAAGDLRRISVAVLVDGTYENIEEDGKVTRKYIPRTDQELEKITGLVKRAVGFNPNRSDAINVTNVPFETSIAGEEDMEQSFLDRYDFIPHLMRYGIILALALLIVFFLFRPLIDWIIRFHEEERLREVEAQQEDVVQSMEQQLVEVRKTIEVSANEYKKKLSDLVDEAPDLVAAVIRQWIGEE